jgi:PhoH-like ATPase
VIEKPEELYSGIARVEVSDGEFRTLGGLLYNGGASTPRLPREEVSNVIKLPELLPNQCCVFASEGDDKELLALYKHNVDNKPYFRGVSKAKPNSHVQPRNTEQVLAYALLTDPEVTLVVLSGIAGGGKSLMALLAGQEQAGKTHTNAIYQQTCVCRSNWEMGKSLGYLKGDLKDKWEPWARPVLDLLELLKVKIDDLEGMINGTNPDIQILPINFIQGRSLNKRFMILDEAQNFTRDEVRAFITRAGAGTKVVLTGDIGQIVNPYLDPFSCGLSHVIQRMQGKDYFGCLNLKISERSTLAQQAADLL